MTDLSARLFRPVDAAGLAYFRIAFYSVMVWECVRFVTDNWLRYWVGKEYYFGYWPLEFVKPLSPDLLNALLWVMIPLAVFCLVGFLYRFSATALFVVFTYFFLAEKARYLNHLYLVSLILFLMIVIPAHRSFSVDALLRTRLRSMTVPSWSLWLLRFQVSVPMFFGGVAKLNHDWLRGEPLRDWLAARTSFPWIGQYFTWEPLVWLMTYWAVFFDICAPFLLLWKRTRVFAFLAALHFHFTNARLFDIGIFPWVMIAATIVFFPPDWPRRVWRDLRNGRNLHAVLFVAGFAVGFGIGGFVSGEFSWIRALIGGLGVAVAGYHIDEPFRQRYIEEKTSGTPGPLTAPRKILVGLLALWVAVQVVVPLRHFAIPGRVHWTEEGHNFSWHMKLRDKDSDGVFYVYHPESDEEWTIDPRDHLTRRQTQKMLSRPHMIIQFVRHLEAVYGENGYEGIEVRSNIEASLNGRDYQTFIDPKTDLTKVGYPWFGHADWIRPLVTPLRAKE